MTTTFRSLALLGALGVGIPVAGYTQEVVRTGQSQAWLGILAEAAELPGESDFAVLITDIYVTGPAHRGGVLPGDLFVAVNGTALSSYDDWLEIVSDLEFGQPFRVGLLREGRAAEVTIIADRRPGMAGASFDRARFDAIQARVWKNADSILQLMVASSPSDSMLLGVMNTNDRLLAAEARIQIRWNSPVQVRREDLELRRESEESLRLAEETQEPPVAGGGGDLRANAETMGADASAAPALTASILGRPVVLGGIQVRDLTAELGRYFSVDSGMLVTDVLAMSPAGRAGFQPGDVILAVADRPVGSLSELRAALAVALLPVSITVVRRGETLDLTYPPG